MVGRRVPGMPRRGRVPNHRRQGTTPASLPITTPAVRPYATARRFRCPTRNHRGAQTRNALPRRWGRIGRTTSSRWQAMPMTRRRRAGRTPGRVPSGDPTSTSHHGESALAARRLARSPPRRRPPPERRGPPAVSRRNPSPRCSPGRMRDRRPGGPTGSPRLRIQPTQHTPRTRSIPPRRPRRRRPATLRESPNQRRSAEAPPL